MRRIAALISSAPSPWLGPRGMWRASRASCMANWFGLHAATKDFSYAMKKIEKALGHASDRRAHFVCALSLAWAEGHVESFEGFVHGELVWPSRGNQGFQLCDEKDRKGAGPCVGSPRSFRLRPLPGLGRGACGELRGLRAWRIGLAFTRQPRISAMR